MIRYCISLIVTLSLSLSSNGQQNMDKYATKVNSLDSIIHNLYGVISGDAGVKRNWILFHYLFLPDAKLMPAQENKSGEVVVSYLSPQDYVDRSGPYLEEKGFHEVELARQTERFGNIAHVISTYAAYQKSTDEKPFMRGINSIQLLYDNNRWWIANIYWQAESRDLVLSEKYLQEK